MSNTRTQLQKPNPTIKHQPNQNPYKLKLKGIHKTYQISKSSRYGTQDTLSDTEILEIDDEEEEEDQDYGSQRKQINKIGIYKQLAIANKNDSQLQYQKTTHQQTTPNQQPHKQDSKQQKEINNDNKNNNKFSYQELLQKYETKVKQVADRQEQLLIMKQANKRLGKIITHNNRYNKNSRSKTKFGQDEQDISQQQQKQQYKQKKQVGIENRQKYEQIYKGTITAIITYLLIMLVNSFL